MEYILDQVKNIQIKEIDEIIAIDLVFNNHYSKVMPRLTKVFLGGYIGDNLVAVLTLGWGVQPVNTIQICFPEMNTLDYYEIGKMCLLDALPKNSETIFLSKVFRWVKQNKPAIKVIYTWADGILGKPGYVYQAANFLYGGFITTDLYITAEGERVHPRTAQSYLKDRVGLKYGKRPTRKFMIDQGWKHYRGKQFRYVMFLCNKRERKRLIRVSPLEWGINYPKGGDISWKKKDMETGKWAVTSKIDYDPASELKYNKTAITNKKKIAVLKKAREFFDF